MHLCLQDAAKRSRTKRDSRLYELRRDKKEQAAKLIRLEELAKKMTKLKMVKESLLRLEDRKEALRYAKIDI